MIHNDIKRCNQSILCALWFSDSNTQSINGLCLIDERRFLLQYNPHEIKRICRTLLESDKIDESSAIVRQLNNRRCICLHHCVVKKNVQVCWSSIPSMEPPGKSSNFFIYRPLKNRINQTLLAAVIDGRRNFVIITFHSVCGPAGCSTREQTCLSSSVFKRTNLAGKNAMNFFLLSPLRRTPTRRSSDAVKL